jgi:hypothetical protein
MMRPSDSRPLPTLGSVRSDELMPAREFCRRMGLGVKAWRQLLARGLPVIRAGKQGFLDGGAVLAFFRKLAEQKAAVGQREGDG